MVGTEWQIIKTRFFFPIVILRDVAIATNLVAKIGPNYLPPALIALSFQKGMGYRYLNVPINSEMTPLNHVKIL